MKKYLIIVFLIFLFGNQFLNARDDEKDKYIKLRDKIVNSFLNRHPDSIYYKDEPKSLRWNYEQGLMLEAFRQLWVSTGDQKIVDYIKKNIDHYVDGNGNIKTYKLTEFNIDNITPGRACLFMYDITHDKRYKTAADTLRKQLTLHPRTKEGGFWHKNIYPYQMWLDGLYMGAPFYSLYSRMFDDTSAYDDIINQFVYAFNHTKDKKTGLLFHAWDESRSQKWADPVTGQSPNFWGRAMGWYMLALTDVIDILPADYRRREELINIFQNIAPVLMKYRDKKTGLWYQLLDKGGKAKNYLESSASSMFIYAFIKGYNAGFLDKKYAEAAIKSFDNLIKINTEIDSDGNINLLNTVKVGGLGGNPYRDGSYDYYMSEPKRTNDFKGYGPFMLASIEIVRYFENRKKVKTGLDYYFNREFRNGKQFHYIWEDTTNSGFSQLGEIIKNEGGLIYSIRQKPSANELEKLNIYIIVDPDTERETEKPNFIDSKSIEVIKNWVKKGGVLMLFANDSNNCEFRNMNKLARRFGITFIENSKNRVKGKEYETGAFSKFPNHPIFSGLNKIFLKEICTISVKAPVKPLLVSGEDVIIAGVDYGKGYVFAVGDPWFYNEYIDHRRLPEEFENDKAAKNIFGWLFSRFIK